MPLIKESSYKEPWIFKSSDISTLYTALLRLSVNIKYERETINTPDKDFLDLDFSKVGSRRLVIISHGLEGSSESAYVLHAVKALNDNNYDVCAWNYRSCGGCPNLLVNSYHSGKSKDLALVIGSLEEDYEEIYLLGYSIGGNITLKYIGENSANINPKIQSAVCFSVPVSLESSAIELAKIRNFLYMKNFLFKLEDKLRIKAKIFPDQIKLKDFHLIRSFIDYDEKYTAPLNGFKNAKDYWTKASSLSYLKDINVPSLLINALDDSFLGPECFPYDIARQSEYLYLETPKHGGHLGFLSFDSKPYSWQERRVLEFFTDQSR